MLNLKVGTIVELLLGLYLFNKVGCVLSFTIYSTVPLQYWKLIVFSIFYNSRQFCCINYSVCITRKLNLLPPSPLGSQAIEFRDVG